MTRFLTRNILVLLLALLSSFPKVAGAGTEQGICACRNPGFATNGTTEKCWGNTGHAVATCTAKSMVGGDNEAACTGAGDCQWADVAGVCTKKAGQTEPDPACSTITNSSDCAAVTVCEWAVGSCQKLTAGEAMSGAACSTITGDIANDPTSCPLFDAGGGARCVWVNKTCECAFAGKNDAATPVATCFAAAAQASDYCTPLLEGTTTGLCQYTGDKFDHCTWVNYNASKVPVPDTAGTCACVNPGYDSTGKTEKCWKTAGTAKTVCAALKTDGDEAGSLTACGANPDCKWNPIVANSNPTSSCGCENEGMNNATTPLAYCYKDTAEDAIFCPGAIGATATTQTACVAAAKATHCKWLAPEATCETCETCETCSSAVAPGALLALLAGLLAYLRC